MKHILCAIFATLAATGATTWGGASESGMVSDSIDWPSFLSCQDILWQKLPTKFDDGAFLGNGKLGTMVYVSGTNRISWAVGRSDVTEHRFDNARLPIGELVLKTAGLIQSGTMRLDLWNAEARGSVTTDKGTIQFRTFVHSGTMLALTEMETTGGEDAASFVWEPGSAQMNAKIIEQLAAMKKEVAPNPPGSSETVEGVFVYTQKRFAGGEFATAWKQTASGKARHVFLSVADSFPANTAHRDALEAVRRNLGSFDALAESHRKWWHELFPRSFVSVPDPKLESFYWIQIYKLASASRPDCGPVDLAGPWYRDVYWSRIWWNLNIETLYLAAYTANQLELGESLVRLFDEHRENFFEQGRNLYGCADGAGVSHTSDNQGRRGDGMLAPGEFVNPGDFTWALHNYYLHYRYSMDHSMITDQHRHAFYPLLRGAANVYMHLLKKGEDGKLHLPSMMSPEYGADTDNNYNLSLARWSLQTLIELNERYDLKAPLLPKWKETLENLTPYPVDENGFRIGATKAVDMPHRHWSHLLMVHPLQIFDLEAPANRELVDRSIRHWLTVPKKNEKQWGSIYGWSRAGAASLYASIGDGGNAIDQIHGHMMDSRFVRPNTIYTEAGMPVVECSIILARALQDMLLQSHHHVIRPFPAMPVVWRDAVFHNFLAEGAFLVSGERKGGRNIWLRVKSLAGEPCRIVPAMVVEVKATVPIKRLERGIYELTLAKGEEALLYSGDQPPKPVVKPVDSNPEACNPWGNK